MGLFKFNYDLFSLFLGNLPFQDIHYKVFIKFLKIRIMIQTVYGVLTSLRAKMCILTKDQIQRQFNNENLLDEVMKQPSIQEVMKSILVVLKTKQHIIQDLYNSQASKAFIEPFGYIFSNGGKRIRLVLAILISGLFTQQLKDQVIQMGGLIQMLHTSSLIIDDIEDQSKSRRDKPCAHLVFGMKKSINSANMMYFLPLKNIIESPFKQQQKRKIIEIYSRQMITCHLGQAQDVYTHKINRVQDLPTLQEYIRMTSAKTSSLFTMLIEMLSVILKIDTKNTDTLINVMRYVGISFQIIDDALNITGNLGKQVKAEDFYQKKFTIIVHHLRKHKEFMQLFFIDKKNEKDVLKMIQIVHQQKTIQYCQEIANGYAQKALKQIQKIDCPFSTSSFKAVVRYVVQRNK